MDNHSKELFPFQSPIPPGIPSKNADQYSKPKKSLCNLMDQMFADSPVNKAMGTPRFVVEGATVICTEGEKDAHLKGCLQNILNVGIHSGLTKTDKELEEKNFGICYKRTKEENEKGHSGTINCVPEFKTDWKNTETVTRIGTVDALTLNSTLSCEKAGKPDSIHIIESGQGGGGSDGFSMTSEEFSKNYHWSTNQNKWVDKNGYADPRVNR